MGENRINEKYPHGIEKYLIEEEGWDVTSESPQRHPRGKSEEKVVMTATQDNSRR